MCRLHAQDMEQARETGKGKSSGHNQMLMSECPSVSLSVCQSLCLSFCLSVHLPVCLSVRALARATKVGMTRNSLPDATTEAVSNRNQLTLKYKNTDLLINFFKEFPHLFCLSPHSLCIPLKISGCKAQAQHLLEGDKAVTLYQSIILGYEARQIPYLQSSC